MPSSRRREPPTNPPARREPSVEPGLDTGATEPAAAEPAEPVRAVRSAGPDRSNRIGPGAGIAYALIGFFASWLMAVGRVNPDNTSEEIAKQLVEVRGRLSAGALLTMFSLFFLIVFAAWLYRWLRSAEGEGGWFATVALVGAILVAATISIVVVLTIALTAVADYGSETVIARTLLTLQWQAIFIAFVPTAAFVGGVAMVGSRTGQLPRWLSMSGSAIAVGLLIPPVAFLPFLLSNLWTGLLAVFLIQRHWRRT